MRVESISSSPQLEAERLFDKDSLNLLFGELEQNIALELAPPEDRINQMGRVYESVSHHLALPDSVANVGRSRDWTVIILGVVIITAIFLWIAAVDSSLKHPIWASVTMSLFWVVAIVAVRDKGSTSVCRSTAVRESRRRLALGLARFKPTGHELHGLRRFAHQNGWLAAHALPEQVLDSITRQRGQAHPGSRRVETREI